MVVHKRIVEAITAALSQDDRKYLLEIFVDDKPTGGYWRMVVIVSPGYDHLISHIKGIGDRIGRYYGEGLYTKQGENYVIFS